VFMRRWLPELAAVPLVHLHEPWTMPPLTQMRLGWTIGVDYPNPIVDPVAAARQARDRLWARRLQPGFREQSEAIVERHGSRRSGMGASGGGRRRKGKGGAGAAAKADGQSSQGVIQLGLDL
jgi:deoxyribodipyrimidine photo-lyase